MADRIRVDTDQFNKWSRMLDGVADDVQSVRSKLLRIDTSAEWWKEVPATTWRANFRGANGRIITQCVEGAFTGRAAVSALADSLSSYSKDIDAVSQKVAAARNCFDDVENKLIGVFSGLGNGTENDKYTGSGDSNNGARDYDFSGIFGYPEDRSKWTEEMETKYDEFVASLKVTYDSNGNPQYYNDEKTIIIEGTTMTVFEASKKFLKYEVSESKYSENGGYQKDSFSAGINTAGYNNKKRERKTKDGKYEQIGKKQEDWGKKIEKNKGQTPKRVQTFLEFGLDESHESSAAHKDIGWENGANKLDVNIDALKTESHKSVTAGLYRSSVNKDGSTEQYLEPGIAANYGRSFTALSMDASYTHGTDDLGITANGEVAVGKAGVEINSQIGWVDGKFAAGVDASIEANLVEASGDVGVNAFGMTGSVGGSVNVGVGAHAKFGVYNGVVSIDIGASIGVGASVRANIDVSGVVTAAADTVKKVNSFIGNCKSALSKASSGFGGWGWMGSR